MEPTRAVIEKVSANGLEHACQLAGKGQPLVLLHGAFGEMSAWEPQWQHFTRHFRVLRYDLRGHGRTGVSPLDRYTIGTFADDLSALLEALDLRDPILVGHSLGGVIAQAFATRQPGRVRALVLANTMASASLNPGEALLRRVLLPYPVVRLTIDAVGVKRFIRFSLGLARLLWGKHWLGRDQAAVRYVEDSMFATDPGEYLKIWGAFYSFDAYPLERIACPVLVLNGEHDSPGMRRHADEILRRIPQAEAGVIPEASHAMILEQPQAFNVALESFLSRLPSRV